MSSSLPAPGVIIPSLSFSPISAADPNCREGHSAKYHDTQGDADRRSEGPARGQDGEVGEGVSWCEGPNPVEADTKAEVVLENFQTRGRQEVRHDSHKVGIVGSNPTPAISPEQDALLRPRETTGFPAEMETTNKGLVSTFETEASLCKMRVPSPGGTSVSPPEGQDAHDLQNGSTEPQSGEDTSRNSEVRDSVCQLSCDRTQSISQPAHHKHGPSGLKLKERCPHFENHDESNPVAERGSAMHKALETGIDNELLGAAEEDYVTSVRKVIRAKINLHANGRGIAFTLKEVRLSAEFGDGITNFGTCDRLDMFDDLVEACMFDYKFGWWQIDDTEDNVQAWNYVLGAFQKYPSLRTIYFYFFVPRQDSVLSHTFTRNDIPIIIDRLRKIIVDAENPNSPYRPGDALCEFCALSRKGQCPAFNSKAIEVATKYAFTSLALPEEPAPDSLPVPANVHGSQISSPEILGQLLRIAPALEKAIEGWKKRAKELVQAGAVIPGFRLQGKSGKREITNAQRVWEIVREKMTPEEFAACADVSVPQLLEAYGRKFPRGQQGASADQLADVLTDLGLIDHSARTVSVVRDHSVKHG